MSLTIASISSLFKITKIKKNWKKRVNFEVSFGTKFVYAIMFCNSLEYRKIARSGKECAGPMEGYGTW